MTMTKQELREMLNVQVAEFLNAGGTVTKRKRAVWAKGAKSSKTMKVASKGVTYDKYFTGPVGLKQTNLEEMGNRASGYSTKYVLA